MESSTMKNIGKLAAVGMLLALAACSKPQGAGVNDPYGGVNSQYPGGVGSNVLGGPNSPEYFKSSVGDTVNFMLDQSTLTPEARGVLANQAIWLNANPSYAAVIEGHADEQGTREYNIALGARRASSVQQYLISQGVQAGRLRTVSYGKERPLAICSTEDCYTKNRRAVTALQVGAGS